MLPEVLVRQAGCPAVKSSELLATLQSPRALQPCTPPPTKHRDFDAHTGSNPSATIYNSVTWSKVPSPPPQNLGIPVYNTEVMVPSPGGGCEG